MGYANGNQRRRREAAAADPRGVLTGPAEVEAFFAGLFESGVSDHTLDIIEVGGDGRIVYGAAHWSLQGKDADGTPQTFSGIATHVFERQEDGTLKLKLHTFN